MKKTFKRIVSLLLVLAVVGGAAWFLLGRDTTVAFSEEKARRQDVATYYTFTGNIEAGSAEFLTARNNGKIKTWHVKEGDTVKKNDVLVTCVYDAQFKAPCDGTITELLVDEDEEFTFGAPLCRIADHENPLVRFRVDEYDVHALKKNMACTVRVLATGDEITGRIQRVAVEGTVAGSLAYYDVELTLPQRESVRMGMSCEIIVPRERADDAITVSMKAIQYDDAGKPFVYRRHREGGIVEQPVFLGINDGQTVVVREGLSEGETVLVPPSFGFDPMAMRDQMMGGH